MDGKRPSVIASQRAACRGPSGFLKFPVVAVLICFAVYQIPSRAGWNPSYHHDHHTVAKFNSKLKYPGEKITWQECGELNGRTLECSDVVVPMDQYNPKNSGNKTFIIPVIRLRGNNATENILVNPGGPGGSGLQFMYCNGEQLNAIIGEEFHLLSFDPRGVNGSKPMATCYPDREIRRSLSYVGGSMPIKDSAEITSWTRSFVQACPDTMGEHGRYVNTPQTAADMNSILEAVGQQDMVYWGFSYGTILGQTYATLFPDRCKRVIIDGVANNFDWYEALLDTESLTDTENVLLGFFDECIKAGQNCPLSVLAKTKEELGDKVLAFLDKLDDEPLSVYVNNTVWGTLDRERILRSAIFPALCKPATWYVLADRLAKLLQGKATEAFLEYGRGGTWDSTLGESDDSDVFVVLNDGATGSEHWPQDRKDFLDLIRPALNASRFAFANGDYYYRQQWRTPKTHTFKQKMGVKTSQPLLILSTTFDPICPLISARSANAAFEGSQIIELRGYGHCSLAMPSNCIAKHVRAFLYNGTVPENYTQCEIDGPYFVEPEVNGTAMALLDFEKSEDRRIYQAQLEIARDQSWPYVW